MTPRAVDDALAAIEATPAQRDQVRALAERLYGHVFRAVARDALYGIEQLLWSELDRLEVPDDLGDVASALLAEALFRLAFDPARSCQTTPSPITELERIAADYDDDCLLCRHDLDEARRRHARGGAAEDDDDEEWAQLEAEAARGWRARHADALRRFGLA